MGGHLPLQLVQRRVDQGMRGKGRQVAVVAAPMAQMHPWNDSLSTLFCSLNGSPPVLTLVVTHTRPVTCLPPHLLLPHCRKLYDVGMRQSAAWGLYLVAGTAAQSASTALSLLLGGCMVYAGQITAQQLTSFMFYVQLVTTSSLAVCDQYGAIMEVS